MNRWLGDGVWTLSDLDRKRLDELFKQVPKTTLISNQIKVRVVKPES